MRAKAQPCSKQESKARRRVFKRAYLCCWDALPFIAFECGEFPDTVWYPHAALEREIPLCRGHMLDVDLPPAVCIKKDKLGFSGLTHVCFPRKVIKAYDGSPSQKTG